MSISQEQELAEYERRMDQMAVNIEKMRADMAAYQDKLALETRWENRKYIVSSIVAVAASVAAGVGLASLVYGHNGSPTPTDRYLAGQSLLSLPPGSSITIPGQNGQPDRVITVQTK
jgi:hypothetical protein